MPLGSKEAMLVEPTDTESKETLDGFDGAVPELAETEPESSKRAWVGRRRSTLSHGLSRHRPLRNCGAEARDTDAFGWDLVTPEDPTV